MPVRKIPKNYRNVTGLVFNSKKRKMTAFESTLERDLYIILDFDWCVEDYEEQPVCIEYIDFNGVLRKYTPDVLIKYKNGNQCSVGKSYMLCEVKYRDELYSGITDFREKFKAACLFAKDQGWVFRQEFRSKGHVFT
ncbi:MAG: TnsA endonuclease N-terminal domain-containing protein [Proteobacteria bacterium]|nr:TnsA endonuclease N-terminal domain-containing protein [Pseudomonadota bacterium]MBU1610474.1 TnsA endonuclease N-terminal domain-containing protein [Pseudomonadota bacterium]